MTNRIGVTTPYGSFWEPDSKAADVFAATEARLKARAEARKQNASWIVGDSEQVKKSLRESASLGALRAAGQSIGIAGQSSMLDLSSPLSLPHAVTLRDSGDFLERWNATKSLGGLKDKVCKEGAEQLSNTVMRQDGGLGLQLNAVQALQKAGPKACHVGAITLARTLVARGPDSNPYMRMSSAAALAAMPDQCKGFGSYALAKAAVDDCDVSVRRNATAAIGDMGADAAGVIGAAALAKALKDDGDINVRLRAADAMRKLGPGALGCGQAALIQAIVKDPDMGVRYRSATALGGMGVNAGADGAARLYKTATEDTIVIVSDSAKAAIAVIHDKAVEILANREGRPRGMSDESHDYLRGTSALILSEFKEFSSREAVELICDAALDLNAYVRRRAIDGLGILGPLAGERGPKVLVKIAEEEDHDDYIQWRAATLSGVEPKADDSLLMAAKIQILIIRKEEDGMIDPEDEKDLQEAEAKAAARAVAEAEREAAMILANAEAAALDAAREAIREPVMIAKDAAERAAEDAKKAQEPLAEIEEAAAATAITAEGEPLAKSYAERAEAAVASAKEAIASSVSAAEAAAKAAEDAVWAQRAAQASILSSAAETQLEPAQAAATAATAAARTAARAPGIVTTALANAKREQEESLTADSREVERLIKVEEERKRKEIEMREEEKERKRMEVADAEAAAVRARAAAEAAIDAKGGIAVLGGADVPEGDGFVEDEASDFEWEGLGQNMYADADIEDGCPPIDEKKATGAFAVFSVYGEFPVDNIKRALTMLGHRALDDAWINEILEKDFLGRSTFDIDDFKKFAEGYEEKTWDKKIQQFREADLDGSGEIDADELSILLENLGVTPATGVVPSLIREVTGDRNGECNFGQYIQVYSIIRDRAGFTRREFKRLDEAFKKYYAAPPVVDENTVAKISADAIKGCISWLGFAVEDDTLLKELLEQEAHGASEATMAQFMQIVRGYVEKEAQRILEAVSEKSKDEYGTIDVQELPDLMGQIGYMISSREVVVESARRCNLLGKRELSFEDLCALMENVRRHEGFLEATLKEINETFVRYDPEGTGEIGSVMLENAIRWMGYLTTFEEAQTIAEQFDVDKTGDIDKGEFTKVMARYRTKEVKNTRKAFAKMGGGKTTFGDDDLILVLKALGYDVEAEDQKALCRSISSSHVGKEVSTWACAEMVGDYRQGVRDELRKREGYSFDEVAKFKKSFEEYDSDHGGTIDSKELSKLMVDMVPECTQDKAAHARLRRMLESANKMQTKKGMTFPGFLKLMRLMADQTSREKLDKEKKALETTHFSSDELKEFRQIFKQFDTDGNGRFDFDELREMISLLVPAAKGDKATKELRTMMAEIDSDGNENLDFPEFLYFMRKILDANWHGVAGSKNAAES